MKENKYYLLFEKMTMGFALHEIITNQNNEPVDYKFLEMNETFSNLTGIEQDAIGSKITEIFSNIKEDPADWISRYGRIALKGGSERFEEYSEAVGKWFDIYTFSPEKGKFATLFQDITKRKRVQQRIKHMNRMLRTVRNVNRLIVREKDPERLIQEACRLLTETRGYSYAWLVLFDENENFETMAYSNHNEDLIKLKNLFKKGDLNRCTQEALQQSGVVTIMNTQQKCQDCPLLGLRPSEREFTIRLEHDLSTYGLLSVSLPKEMATVKEEKDLLEEIAGDLAFALYSIEIEKQRQKEAKEKSQILNNTSELIAYHNLDNTLVWAN